MNAGQEFSHLPLEEPGQFPLTAVHKRAIKLFDLDSFTSVYLVTASFYADFIWSMPLNDHLLYPVVHERMDFYNNLHTCEQVNLIID